MTDTTTTEKPRHLDTYGVRADNPTIAHIRKYPFQPPAEAGAALGLTSQTISFYRHFLRKKLGENIPFPSAKEHARQVARERKAEHMRTQSTAIREQATMEETKSNEPAPTLTHDPVYSPSHYTSGGIEAIDFIQAKLTPEEFAGYCKGNALKYMSRAGKKDNSGEDLAKARWYLDRLLTVRGTGEDVESGEGRAQSA